jgi:hypothetical protein
VNVILCPDDISVALQTGEGPKRHGDETGKRHGAELGWLQQSGQDDLRAHREGVLQPRDDHYHRSPVDGLSDDLAQPAGWRRVCP